MQLYIAQKTNQQYYENQIVYKIYVICNAFTSLCLANLQMEGDKELSESEFIKADKLNCHQLIQCWTNWRVPQFHSRLFNSFF
jgi:hypothetical protein